jgi:hypothetical protein
LIRSARSEANSLFNNFGFVGLYDVPVELVQQPFSPSFGKIGSKSDHFEETCDSECCLVVLGQPNAIVFQ